MDTFEAKLVVLLVAVLTAVGLAVTSLSPGDAGAATRPVTARVPRVPANHSQTAHVARRAIAKASDKDTGATTSEFQVCKVAGDPKLDNVSFPFIEGNWSGSFYTSYSLTAVPAPGSCGPEYSFAPGTTVLVEEAASPGVPVPGVTPSFSVTNGSLASVVSDIDLAAVVVGSGLTTLTVTDLTTSLPQQGTLELCKSAADKYVQGSFDFNVSAPGFSSPQSVPTGQCNDVSVPAGSVSITENVRFPYALTSVSALPKASLVSSDLNTQNAVVAVPSGGDTTVFFKNATLTGFAKVCKTLARPADNVLAGRTFTFSVNAAFDGRSITKLPTSVSVIAANFGTTTCSFLSNRKGPIPLPLGTLVTFTETGLPPTIQSVGTSVSPANLNAGSSPATAQLYVGNLPAPNNFGNLGRGSVTQATFTNEAFGYVEVCKVSSSIEHGIPFQFSIGGLGPIQPVPVGLCSLGFLLPVGTTTISETLPAHVSLHNVSSTSGSTWSGSTATVTVPYDNENIVTFDNEITTGTLKICKAQTSSDAGLQGTTFNLSYSYVHNGVKVNGPDEALKPGQCTLPINGVPVLNQDLSPIRLSITEQTTTVADIGVFSVSVVGGDTVVSSPAPPTHLLSSPGGGTPATLVLNSREGITNVTFVNGIDITG